MMEVVNKDQQDKVDEYIDNYINNAEDEEPLIDIDLLDEEGI